MEFSNFFVVFDPTCKEQPALERAALIAAETGSKLHVFACIHSDIARSAETTREIRALIDQQQAEMDRVVSPLREKGLTVSTEVEWDKDWYQAVVRASISNGADVVLKSSYRHKSSQRILNRTSDWTLIRECLCPVMLVKDDTHSASRRVLAAIDFSTEKEAYEDLNRRIIDFGQRMMDNEHAEVHFINAHRDLSSSPDRNALVRSCGVESDQVHIRLGEPEDIIVENAKQMNVGLVIVGNSARTGLSALVKGNTVEKLVDRLECDILAMP
jgi:universal stress protein E